MSKEDLIYMAGLIDGEGTIGIAYDGAGFRKPYVSITSTTPEIIEWLSNTYGGVVCNQKTYKAHHKPSWSWRLRRKADVRELLCGIRPYMKEPEKIRRASMLLDEWDSVTPRNGKYTEELKARKIDFEARFLA